MSIDRTYIAMWQDIFTELTTPTHATRSSSGGGFHPRDRDRVGSGRAQICRKGGCLVCSGCALIDPIICVSGTRNASLVAPVTSKQFVATNHHIKDAQCLHNNLSLPPAQRTWSLAPLLLASVRQLPSPKEPCRPPIPGKKGGASVRSSSGSQRAQSCDERTDSWRRIAKPCHLAFVERRRPSSSLHQRSQKAS